MTNKFIFLVTALTAVSVASVFAQEGTTKAGEGTLTLNKKTYTLKQALAYEATIDDEEATVLVLSGQAISGEQLKAARDAEKEGGVGDFTRPFLKLVFKKTGELKDWSAATN